MNSIIIDRVLFGEEEFSETIKPNEEHRRNLKKAVKLIEKLKDTLDEEHNEFLEELIEAAMGMEYECSAEYFKAGFKYAFRLAVECLFD